LRELKEIESDQKKPKTRATNKSILKDLKEKAISAIGLEMHNKIYNLINENLRSYVKKDVK